jgi:hypothetical protein
LKKTVSELSAAKEQNTNLQQQLKEAQNVLVHAQQVSIAAKDVASASGLSTEKLFGLPSEQSGVEANASSLFGEEQVGDSPDDLNRMSDGELRELARKKTMMAMEKAAAAQRAIEKEEAAAASKAVENSWSRTSESYNSASNPHFIVAQQHSPPIAQQQSPLIAQEQLPPLAQQSPGQAPSVFPQDLFGEPPARASAPAPTSTPTPAPISTPVPALAPAAPSPSAPQPQTEARTPVSSPLNRHRKNETADSEQLSGEIWAFSMTEDHRTVLEGAEVQEKLLALHHRKQSSVDSDFDFSEL